MLLTKNLFNTIDTWTKLSYTKNGRNYDCIMIKINHNIWLKYPFIQYKNFCYDENMKDFILFHSKSIEYVTLLNDLYKNLSHKYLNKDCISELIYE